VTCPTCQGEKERAGIGCGPRGFRPMILPCPTCEGTGEISDERARWIAEGKRLQRYRLTGEYTSMLTAAVRAGVSLGSWSAAEAGRVDPAPLIARVNA